MNTKHENFYISPELSEVIDLVSKRQALLMTLDLGADEATEEEEYVKITARLEKLVLKYKFTTEEDLS